MPGRAGPARARVALAGLTAVDRAAADTVRIREPAAQFRGALDLASPTRTTPRPRTSRRRVLRLHTRALTTRADPAIRDSGLPPAGTGKKRPVNNSAEPERCQS